MAYLGRHFRERTITKSTKLLALIFSITLAGDFILVCPAKAASPAAEVATAKLTEAHGNIFKRGFIDWTKETWADPEPAIIGDALHEGMQIGTGDKSWAQVTWPNVTTRAWSNTVFAIAPNQKLVYLIGGEMLFNLKKERKDKSAYLIWTKTLQARIRGTTVLVQALPTSSKITVLEGTIDVMNRIDHSLVRLTPGCVLEIKTPEENPQEKRQASETKKISLQKSSPKALFSSEKSFTEITSADPDALANHPLVVGFESKLESKPLVDDSLEEMPRLATQETDKDFDQAIVKVDKSLCKQLHVVRVPINIPYLIGPDLGKDISIAQEALYNSPPSGTIAQGDLDDKNGKKLETAFTTISEHVGRQITNATTLRPSTFFVPSNTNFIPVQTQTFVQQTRSMPSTTSTSPPNYKPGPNNFQKTGP
jgi:hypothetical protein